MKKIYDVLILGGGASGLMCGAMADKNLEIAIVEHNEKEAKKLKISGGGKCNITNVDVSEDNFDGNYEMLEYALTIFSKEALLEFLQTHNIELELRKGRYYFCKNSSQDVINLLQAQTKHIKRYLNTEILSLTKEQEIFTLHTPHSKLNARKVVVATGAKSFDKVGASEIGLEIAKSFNIETKPFTPALVGLTLQKEQFWMKELSGLSCYVEIEVAGKIIKEEMLFAHKGISGPAVLSASLYWKSKDITINFLPECDILQLASHSKKLLSTLIPLPKRLAKALLDALDIKDVVASSLTHQEREKLSMIHAYSFSPAGNFGFSKAEVCRGGVKAEELDIYSLMSKKVENLYFIGEVVDITGELGGYNLQWAFSSGVICAQNL